MAAKCGHLMQRLGPNLVSCPDPSPFYIDRLARYKMADGSGYETSPNHGGKVWKLLFHDVS